MRTALPRDAFKLSEALMRYSRLVPLLLAVLVACNRPASGPPARHQQSLEFPAAAGKLVEVELGSLDVEVRVSERQGIRAEVDLEARSSSRSAASRWVESHTPPFEDAEARLVVRQPRGRTSVMLGFLRTHGLLVLELPASARLEVRTGSGDVLLAGDANLTGTVRLKTTSGDLTIEGGAGDDLVLETTSGDVSIDGVELGSLDVSTRSGDVELDGRLGKAAIETTSGDIRLDGLRGGLEVETRSGDVEAEWKSLEGRPRVMVRATSGDVTLDLPRVAIRGEVRTGGGSIDSELDGRFDRRRRSLTIEATDARLEIEVRTTSGDVRLRATGRAPAEASPES